MSIMLCSVSIKNLGEALPTPHLLSSVHKGNAFHSPAYKFLALAEESKLNILLYKDFDETISYFSITLR